MFKERLATPESFSAEELQKIEARAKRYQERTNGMASWEDAMAYAKADMRIEKNRRKQLNGPHRTEILESEDENLH